MWLRWCHLDVDGDSGKGHVGLRKNCLSLKLDKPRCSTPLFKTLREVILSEPARPIHQKAPGTRVPGGCLSGRGRRRPPQLCFSLKVSHCIVPDLGLLPSEDKDESMKSKGFWSSSKEVPQTLLYTFLKTLGGCFYCGKIDNLPF